MFVYSPPQRDAQAHTITLNYNTIFGQYGIRFHTSRTKYQQDNRQYQNITHNIPDTKPSRAGNLKRATVTTGCSVQKLTPQRTKKLRSLATELFVV